MSVICLHLIDGNELQPGQASLLHDIPEPGGNKDVGGQWPDHEDVAAVPLRLVEETFRVLETRIALPAAPRTWPLGNVNAAFRFRDAAPAGGTQGGICPAGLRTGLEPQMGLEKFVARDFVLPKSLLRLFVDEEFGLPSPPEIQIQWPPEHHAQRRARTISTGMVCTHGTNRPLAVVHIVVPFAEATLVSGVIDKKESSWPHLQAPFRA